MRNAYRDYTEDMAEAMVRLNRGQAEAYKLSDISSQRSEIYRLQAVYVTDSSQNSQLLQSRIQQSWSTYQSQQNACGATYDTGTYPFQNSSTVVPYNPYGTSTNYGYPYTYTYPSAYNYSYGYGYSNAYQYNRGYWPYAQNYCPHIMLTQPTAGCGYQCRYDTNGCQTCEVVCR
jgi:hypothetical protein